MFIASLGWGELVASLERVEFVNCIIRGVIYCVVNGDGIVSLGGSELVHCVIMSKILYVQCTLYIFYYKTELRHIVV